MRCRVRVQTEAFDLAAETAALQDAGTGIGAVVTFTGHVRGGNAAGQVSAIELEHYPAMTEKSLQALVAEAVARWPLSAVTLIHRVGYLPAGEAIVLVAVACAHRAEAFAAASFLMDFLKTRAPFWKKEWVDGQARWVEAKASDAAAADRWQS